MVLQKSVPSDEVLDFLETQIPSLGAAATHIAFLNALAAGQSVLIAEKGAIFEVSPDGSRRFIKELAPSLAVTKNSTIQLTRDAS